MEAFRAEWRSRDPEGEGSDATLYSYVLNSPINAFDPLGLDAIFTYANGTTQVATTASGFVAAANSATSANLITKIIIDGHANSLSQSLTTDPSNQNEIAYGAPGDPSAVSLKNSGTDPGKLLKDVLNGKLAKGAKIVLRGCHAGDDSQGASIAAGVSKALGVASSGSPTDVDEKSSLVGGLSYDYPSSGATLQMNQYSNGTLTGSISRPVFVYTHP